MYLLRNQYHVFSVFYDKRGAPFVKWFLSISLLVESDIETSIINCSKDNHDKDFWFICNDVGVKFMESHQVPLLNDRRNREISLKFLCDSSCDSMKTIKMSKIKFSIKDDHDVEHYQQIFSIHISERPKRDMKYSKTTEEQP